MKAYAIQSVQYHTCALPGGHKLPNAATRRYHLEKTVDALLAAAIVLGVVVIALVLVTM